MLESWRNIADAVAHYAAARPDSPAIVEGPRILSYADLARLVDKGAGFLARSGVRPGDRAGVCLTNCADHLVLSLALMRLGAALVEISPQTGQADREALVGKFGIGTLFVEPDNPAVRGTTTMWIDVAWQESLETESGAERATAEAEPYVIGLTSGSTGLPKGLVTTHGNHFHRFRAAAEIFKGTGILSVERPAYLLLAAEIAFTGYFQFLVFQLLIGGPILVVPKHFWVADLVRSASAWSDTVGLVTPLMARGFIAYARQQGLLFPNMRALIVLGQPLFAEEKRAVVEKVTPRLYDVYGNAGCGIISTLSAADMITMGGSVGRPAPSTEVEIVDSQGQRLSPGQVGHVRCRGPGISARFYDPRDGTSGVEGFRDGWYYPGDFGTFDQQGLLSLKGRSSDMIVRSGVPILPAEIEAALAAHPLVLEVGVVGRPAQGAGEEVVALVVMRSPAAHEDLILHCRTRLPPEKLPDQIIAVASLPKTHIGKIDRAELKSLALRRAG